MIQGFLCVIIKAQRTKNKEQQKGVLYVAKNKNKSTEANIKAVDKASRNIRANDGLQGLKLRSKDKVKQGTEENAGHVFDMDDLAKEISNETYTDKGPKLTVNEIESILTNPSKSAQAELLSGHDLTNASNNVKLGWEIAKGASEKFGGKPVEYIRGGAIKLASGIVKQVNELKPIIANIGSADQIIERIIHEYEMSIIEQSRSGEISRGVIYQIDRLRQILNNYQINGVNAKQTGFWQWVTDFGAIKVEYQGFYNSGDDMGSVNSVDAGPLLRGTQAVIDQIDALVPAYLASQAD